ncbi:MAG: hypothetical protein AB7P03_15185 [Kofleriaceae bacterium]
MKLGTLLLRNAAIGLTQLEGALRNQVLYGGRLGTNLVELGFIDLEMLSGYLSELTGFPIATASLLDDAHPPLLDKLGADLAHQVRAIPLHHLGDAGKAAAVAFVDPTDAKAIATVESQIGLKVMPYVVPELRALYYLEKLFGTPRRARFIRMARPGSDADVIDDRRKQQPAQGMVMPPIVTLEPRRRRASSQVQLSSAPIAVSYGAACERIDTAPHREQIVEALVEYGKGRCDAFVVFLIRDGNALGWRGWVAPPTVVRTPIEQLSLPLGGASALQSAHDAGEPYVGAAPPTARPVETKLWSALGAAPEPSSLAVVPIMVKQRAVNLIYLHVQLGEIAASLVTELTDLANRAQASYLRLIKLARGS